MEKLLTIKMQNVEQYIWNILHWCEGKREEQLKHVFVFAVMHANIRLWGEVGGRDYNQLCKWAQRPQWNVEIFMFVCLFVCFNLSMNSLFLKRQKRNEKGNGSILYEAINFIILGNA